MASSTELEPEVIAELNNGQKIEAIKKLRVLRNLGLKDAKELVDLYLSLHPELDVTVQRSGRSGFIVLIILAVAAYFFYTIMI
jgi:ribosomal L7/L12-like protein